MAGPEDDDRLLAGSVEAAREAAAAERLRLGRALGATVGAPPEAEEAEAVRADALCSIQHEVEHILRCVDRGRAELAAARAEHEGRGEDDTPPGAEAAAAGRRGGAATPAAGVGRARVEAWAAQAARALEEEDRRFTTVMLDTGHGLAWARLPNPT
ncbi:unnamed protein product [Prorocentrum cordatum]|uniref:Uncharacterized protein n=1 Tax=Prorocentrum cordatum TaxID=2364126 RepID=A0ABN9PB76_9DINO|nr:unnamed protein product [Polarella glacialis]